MQKIEPSGKTEQQAREWLIRLYSDDITAEEQCDFKSWLTMSSANPLAYQATEKIWRGLGELQESNILQPIEKHIRSRYLDILKPVAIAACLVLVLFTSLFFQNNNPVLGNFSTTSGQIKDVVLADGSVISLAANSKITTSYSSDKREINLLSGQAYFDITKNTERPMTVTIADTVVHVTGTEFNINKNPQEIRISVTEGTVIIGDKSPQKPTGSFVKLSMNDQLVTDLNGHILKKTNFDINEVISWRTGRLVYIDEKLINVIAEVNRYREIPIKIMNAELNDIKISASFNAYKSNQMLEGLALSYPVTINENDHSVIIRFR
ncbi:MAG: FecR domain-containing protein [Emcibacteraceae bacterium]|nr:FecR domain-containing protein [Emcibacteraceae bacterium]